MKIFRFDKNMGEHITKFQSNFIMTKILKTTSPTHIGCMYLEANGIIGYHDAVVPQILLVVHGEGWVTGGNNQKVKIKEGEAVFWDKGEGHETRTETGLSAIVIESQELDPSKFMKTR